MNVLFCSRYFYISLLNDTQLKSYDKMTGKTDTILDILLCCLHTEIIYCSFADRRGGRKRGDSST